MELSAFSCAENLKFWKPHIGSFSNSIIIPKIPALANGDREVFAKLLRLDLLNHIKVKNKSHNEGKVVSIFYNSKSSVSYKAIEDIEKLSQTINKYSIEKRIK